MSPRSQQRPLQLQFGPKWFRLESNRDPGTTYTHCAVGIQATHVYSPLSFTYILITRPSITTPSEFIRWFIWCFTVIILTSCWIVRYSRHLKIFIVTFFEFVLWGELWFYAIVKTSWFTILFAFGDWRHTSVDTPENSPDSIAVVFTSIDYAIVRFPAELYQIPQNNNIPRLALSIVGI